MNIRNILIVLAVFSLLLVLPGCQQRVVRDTTYSPEQFPQYSHLPRTRTAQQDDADTDWTGKVTGGAKSVGNGIANGARNVGDAIGEWMPW